MKFLSQNFLFKGKTTQPYFSIQNWDKDHSTQHEMAILIIYRFPQNIKANYQKRAIKLPFLTTHEQTLVSAEYIRIQAQLKDSCTPQVIRNTMVSRFC